MRFLGLLKEDLKHVVWLLGLAVVLAALYVYPGTNLADVLIDSALEFSMMRRAWPFLLIFYCLVAAILTSRLLSKDSVCDVDAFWLSKPFSGGQLLASKLMVLALVYLVIPGGFLWMVASHCGEGMPWGAVVRLVYWTGWFAPAVVFFSAHTKGLATMLVATTSFGVALFLGYIFFDQFYVLGIRPEMGGFYVLAAYVIYVGSVGLAIVLPFWGRKIALSRRIALGGVLMAVAIPVMGLKAYLGLSDRVTENVELGRTLVVKEPVLKLSPTQVGTRPYWALTGTLEFEQVPEDILFQLRFSKAEYRESLKPPMWRSDNRGGVYVGAGTFQTTLAGALIALDELNEESILNLQMPKTFEFRDKIVAGPEEYRTDGGGRWDVNFSLDRLEIEHVKVVPLVDGQEVAYGGIRTVFRKWGESADYSKYLLVEYSYDDLATSSPIQFRRGEPVERLHRVYFLKGKSGRLWKPEISLMTLEFAEMFGLRKRLGDLGEILPLTDGLDGEELELVVIDVRHLGNVGLRVNATAVWDEDE